MKPQLRDYVTGRLTRHDHGVVEEHVEGCSACRDTVAHLDESTVLPFPEVRPVDSASVQEDAELSVLVSLAQAVRTHAGGDSHETFDPTLAPGTRIGPYVVESLVGAGGMGHVYRARHTHMKRGVAIKVVAPHRLRSTAARERFRREIETAARVHHPNVVTALDAGEFEGSAYLVMEFVAGRDLDDVVRTDGPLEIDAAVDAVRQAALGLQAAHAAGIVHRDVKPSNLVRTEEGVVKVLDLGIARALDEESAGLTSSETLLGSVAYLAPEQAANARTAAEPADVYALGATLFTLLTGRPVFETNTAVETIVAHRERPTPSIRDVRPDCPEWLARFFGRMLAKKPSERPSISQVIAAIEQRKRDPIASLPRTSGDRSMHAFVAIAAALLVVAAASFAYRAFFSVPRETPEPDPRPVVVDIPKAAADPLVRLVAIPAGTFLMGASDETENARPEERPAHEVRLTKPFQLASHEVTVDQWRTLMQEAPEAEAPTDSGKGDLPIAGVSWREAVLFCNRLSEREGLRPFYEITDETVAIRGGTGYRLPTEAEWEYACRAGSTTRWSFGDDPTKLSEHAWFAENAVGELHAVGRLKPNAWGLFDMHGNVPEWCWDRYAADYYAKSEPINPPGPTSGQERVFRGGSASDAAVATRSSSRRPLGGSYGGFTNPVGLRVARNVE